VLQYFIRLLKRRDPDLLRLSRDFRGNTLAEAKRLPLDVMTEEMKELVSSTVPLTLGTRKLTRHAREGTKEPVKAAALLTGHARNEKRRSS
jgi:hypothetical protein